MSARNLSAEQRWEYMQYVSRVTPASIPNNYDCADTGLYIYDQAMQAATGQQGAYTNVTKNGSHLSNLQDIQAADTFGTNNQNNKIINYYNADGREQTYDSSKDEAYNKIANWIDHYNFERPHSALGYATPAEVRNKLVA
ncbi:hypothetical protein TRIP_E350020 [uncultured Spirochaetota bacterium]|nr:hypothetical protein TRIP_E350020 [uncultured Spirochaetota bacterium]